MCLWIERLDGTVGNRQAQRESERTRMVRSSHLPVIWPFRFPPPDCNLTSPIVELLLNDWTSDKQVGTAHTKKTSKPKQRIIMKTCIRCSHDQMHDWRTHQFNTWADLKQLHLLICKQAPPNASSMSKQPHLA